MRRPPIESWPKGRWRWLLRTSIATLLSVLSSVEVHADSVSEFDCVIEPQQIVKLASPVVGVIARLDVDRGDVIRKGQALGKLDDGVEEANLALAKVRASSDHLVKSAQARLDFLRRKSGRAGQLMAHNFASQAIADEAEADLKVAEQQLTDAKLNLEIARLDVKRYEQLLQQRQLVSPIDGVVRHLWGPSSLTEAQAGVAGRDSVQN